MKRKLEEDGIREEEPKTKRMKYDTQYFFEMIKKLFSKNFKNRLFYNRD
jgi:hypothetical protein